MANLPVSAQTFFDDFSDDVSIFSVSRNFSEIASYKGLLNDDEHGSYIGFLTSDNPDIIPGDMLSADSKSYYINEIDYDKYNSAIELMKAYY